MIKKKIFITKAKKAQEGLNLILLLYATLCAFVVNSSCIKREVTSHEAEEAIVIDPLRIQAAEIVAGMDDRILTAQVLICGIDGKGKLPFYMKELLIECPSGGVMLFKYNLDTNNAAIRSYLTEVSSLIQNESGSFPFIAVDHEGGIVSRFLPGVATLPAASYYRRLAEREGREAALTTMAIIEKIENDSYKAGREIKDLGINMNFAPVAEYLNDDNSDFLRFRSYGPDPYFTAEAAAAFIRGMEQAGVLCVIKHFPGSAGVDPHYFTSVIKGDKADLGKLVLPFAALIGNAHEQSGKANGKDNGNINGEPGVARAVMIAHSLVPSLDNEIASLSPLIMENWLRGELGFQGIIISDDFLMASAKNAAATGGKTPEDAAVCSIAAGADMVLVWPPDIRRTHKAFLASIENGKLSRERLQEAAGRIIYEKLKLGFDFTLQ